MRNWARKQIDPDKPPPSPGEVLVARLLFAGVVLVGIIWFITERVL